MIVTKSDPKAFFKKLATTISKLRKLNNAQMLPHLNKLDAEYSKYLQLRNEYLYTDKTKTKESYLKNSEELKNQCIPLLTKLHDYILSAYVMVNNFLTVFKEIPLMKFQDTFKKNQEKEFTKAANKKGELTLFVKTIDLVFALTAKIKRDSEGKPVKTSSYGYAGLVLQMIDYPGEAWRDVIACKNEDQTLELKNQVPNKTYYFRYRTNNKAKK